VGEFTQLLRAVTGPMPGEAAPPPPAAAPQPELPQEWKEMLESSAPKTAGGHGSQNEPTRYFTPPPAMKAALNDAAKQPPAMPAPTVVRPAQNPGPPIVPNLPPLPSSAPPDVPQAAASSRLPLILGIVAVVIAALAGVLFLLRSH
jgi:hypothetical protein